MRSRGLGFWLIGLAMVGFTLGVTTWDASVSVPLAGNLSCGAPALGMFRSGASASDPTAQEINDQLASQCRSRSFQHVLIAGILGALVFAGGVAATISDERGRTPPGPPPPHWDGHRWWFWDGQGWRPQPPP